MATPNLKEIEWAIHELEQEESSRLGYIFLGALYTCRKELMGEPVAGGYSTAPPPVTKPAPLDLYGDSDFLRSIRGKDPAEAWAVMDELMDSLKAVNPRVYDGVMRKIYNL